MGAHLIGDNNDPSPAADQNDKNFVIVGRDVDGDEIGIKRSNVAHATA